MQFGKHCGAPVRLIVLLITAACHTYEASVSEPSKLAMDGTCAAVREPDQL